MDYIQVVDGQVQGYPRTLPKNAHNVSNFYLLPQEKLLEYGWYPVRFVPNPNKTETSVVTGQNFVVEGNEVVQYEQVREKTQEELDQESLQMWENVRNERTRYLEECDWTQLPDTPLTEEQKIQWQTYRQQLRDITTQQDPYNIVWPIKPE